MSNITLDQAEAERLELLIEEASEVIKAATKILRHGYESYDPTKPAIMRRTNRLDLEEEVGDLLAAVTRMNDAGDLRLVAAMDRRDYKLSRGGRYLHHQAPFFASKEELKLSGCASQESAARVAHGNLRRSLQSMRPQDQVIEPMHEVRLISEADYEKLKDEISQIFGLPFEVLMGKLKKDPEPPRSR